MTLEALRSDVMEKVIKTTIPSRFLDENTKYHINPCGHFVIGGPMGDAGLTGCKIILHLWRVGRAWRRRLQWQRLYQGGPLGCLCRKVGG